MHDGRVEPVPLQAGLPVLRSNRKPCAVDRGRPSNLTSGRHLPTLYSQYLPPFGHRQQGAGVTRGGRRPDAESEKLHLAPLGRTFERKVRVGIQCLRPGRSVFRRRMIAIFDGKF